MLSLAIVILPLFRLGPMVKIEIFMSTGVRSSRRSMGAGISTGKWHHLLVSYDENASDDYGFVYLDGLLTGYTSDLGGKLQVKPSDDWLLGAAKARSS